MTLKHFPLIPRSGCNFDITWEEQFWFHDAYPDRWLGIMTSIFHDAMTAIQAEF